MDVERMESAVEALLAEHPDGLEEQALLRLLRERPESGMPPERPVTMLALFRSHFALFHVLYRLRDRLRSAGTGDVQIEPMNIRVLPRVPGDAALGAHDRLRSYYLDLDNLAATDEEDVDRLLSGFHTELARREGRAEALAILELGEPADDADIRRQYRRLAMRHHPDRGGDAERLQEINRAIEILAPRRSG